MNAQLGSLAVSRDDASWRQGPSHPCRSAAQDGIIGKLHNPFYRRARWPLKGASAALGGGNELRGAEEAARANALCSLASGSALELGAAGVAGHAHQVGDPKL
jgi:hypothetical protein